MRILAALIAFVGWTGAGLAQAPLDPSTMKSSDIAGLQRRLTDARCYNGVIDGKQSPALLDAIKACPDQRPVLRIETGNHVASVGGVAADARCGIIATGSDDKTVRVWAPDGRLLRTVRLPSGQGEVGKIYAVDVSPDGRWIVAGGLVAADASDETIFLIDSTTGQVVRRLGVGALGEVVDNLAFSPDGQRVAASLGSGGGFRLLDVASGRELANDRDYGGKDANGVAFAPDGSVFAVGYDGFIRRYTRDGRRAAKVRGTHTKLYSVSVDPSGRRIAVGSFDVAAVDFHDAGTLRRLGGADVAGLADDLNRVSWSGDGSHLIGGGNAGSDNRKVIVSWTPDGRRVGPPVGAATDQIMALRPCGDGAVFGSFDGSFGRVAPDGRVTVLGRSHSPDKHTKLASTFTVSPDGKRVRFGLGPAAEQAVLVDLVAETLADAPSLPAELRSPLTTGLPVTDWQDEIPRFRGRKLISDANDYSRALAVRPDRAGFALATEFSVFAFDGNGSQIWSVGVPAAGAGINLARDGELIVVFAADGTVRWLRWRDGQELLALFVHRDTKQWVAWTPSGYYAASPGAEDMIGWHVNRGWDQPADFFPASKFRETYARPDIVARVLDTLDEPDAIRRANALRPEKASAKPISDLLPPVVTIVSPAESGVVTGDEVRIDYLVRSPAGLPVDGIEALVDGRPASRERGLGRPAEDSGLRACLAGTAGPARSSDGAGGGCRGSISVRLPPGATEVGLFARTGDRAGDVSKVRLVRAAASRSGGDEKPKLYALVVGISAYNNTDYTLQFAAKDARDFTATLLTQKGGAFYQDVLVRSVTDGQATKTGILDGLEWLTKQVTNRDVGLVYLAGHGVLDERERFYFVAADSDIDRLRATGVPREDIQDALDALPGKALLFLDACHSGAVGSSKVRQETININGVANEFARTERGVVMFTASTGKQVSQENAAWGNGAFTLAVIEGLRGKADLLHKGAISASALDVYISERVKELTGGRQSPVMIRPSTVPDFTLAAVRN